jgi:hypothetical protein
MNYILFEHKHSFRNYFFRPQHSFFSIRKSRRTLFFLNLSVKMFNINNFSGGHFYYSTHFETQRDHWETSYLMCCATGGALRNRATLRAESRNTNFNDLLKQEPTRKWPLNNCFSPRIKLFSFYGFDLKALESSMFFAVFRSLRTPVPNGQFFTYLGSLERPWPVDGS